MFYYNYAELKTLAQGAADMKRLADEYKTFERNLPKIAGAVAVKVIHENFEKQGFVESKGTQTKWSARKPQTNYAYDNYKTYKGNRYGSDRPILLQSRNLYRGISFKIEGEHKVFVGVDLNLVPYAKFVNERVRNGTQDKYIGWSKGMAESIHAEIVKRRAKIFKNFEERNSKPTQNINLGVA